MNLALVIDCSASMSGAPISEARHLVAALSRLVRERIVEGTVSLSLVRSSTGVCQTIKLPMADRDIVRIAAYGEGEGLATTLQTISPLARKADLVLLYTDGSITDIALDKSALHRQGIFTYGLYVGPLKQCPKLMLHVDHPIQGNSLEEVVGRFGETARHHRVR